MTIEHPTILITKDEGAAAFTIDLPTNFGDSYLAEEAIKAGPDFAGKDAIEWDSEGSHFFAYAGDAASAASLATELRKFAMLTLGYGNVVTTPEVA